MRIFGLKIRFRDAFRVLIDAPGDFSLERRKELETKLRSHLCQCGDRKWGAHPFCKRCFDTLPKKMRGRLFFMYKRKFLRNYEEAAALVQQTRRWKDFWEAYDVGAAKIQEQIIFRPGDRVA